MDKKEREKYISKIQKFVDGGEEVDGRIRFNTNDGIRATYAMALVILDMNERMKKEELDYNKRTREFDRERGTG